MKALLLGVGMQGKAALHDLVNCDDVTGVVAADYAVDALKVHVAKKGYGAKVACEHVDACDPASIERLFAHRPDVVINLLPNAFMEPVAAAALRHGAHVVTSSYATPPLRALADQAKDRGLAILPEFGLDPGIDLVMLGEAVRSLETVEHVHCYGAGIPEPEAADNPIRYKVTWTFEGVLGSYRRPGRILREGKVIDIPADEQMQPVNVHEIDVEGLGRLEAYPNGDALRYAEAAGLDMASLASMGRYSCRWPGHAQFWRTMVGLHLLDDEPVVVDGVAVDRKRFLAAAMGPHLRLGDDQRDIALVRNEVCGTRGGSKVRLVHQVVDRRDLATGFTAMSRTVGYTASIGAIMLAAGKITRRGLLSPVTDVPYAPFVNELQKRGVQVTVRLPATDVNLTESARVAPTRDLDGVRS